MKRGHERMADFIDGGQQRRSMDRERAAWEAFRTAAARKWLERLISGQGRIELG